jgi:hypothetical protein
MKVKKIKAETDFVGTDTVTIVDEIGKLAAIVADFEKKKKALVVELLARAGTRRYIDGKLYTATIVSECATASLDTELVKAEMGDKWFADHCKAGSRKASVRVAARKTPDQKKE